MQGPQSRGRNQGSGEKEDSQSQHQPARHTRGPRTLEPQPHLKRPSQGRTSQEANQPALNHTQGRPEHSSEQAHLCQK